MRKRLTEVAAQPVYGGQTQLLGPADVFARAMRTVLPFAGSDFSRPNLCQVLLRIERGKWTLVASDGHTFAKWVEPIGAIDQDGQSDFAMSVADAADVVAKFRREKSTLMMTPLGRDWIRKTGIRLAAGDDGHNAQVGAHPFPRWESAVPREDSKAVARTHIGMNATYVARAYNAFTEAVKGRKDSTGDAIVATVKAEFTGVPSIPDDEAALRFTSHDVPQLYVLVMPARL